MLFRNACENFKRSIAVAYPPPAGPPFIRVFPRLSFQVNVPFSIQILADLILVGQFTAFTELGYGDSSKHLVEGGKVELGISI